MLPVTYDAATPPPLLRLSYDIWNGHLCYYLTADCYGALWECMDRRLQSLLYSLSVDVLSLNALHLRRIGILRSICRRAKRHLIVSRLQCAEFPSFASDAAVVDVRVEDVRPTLSFLHWPNLQSLRLVNIRRKSKERVSFQSTLRKLPPSLTALTLLDEFVRGCHRPNNHGSDPLSVTKLICERLPNLQELDIKCCALLASSPQGPTCTWPAGLTTLALRLQCAVDVDAINIALPPNLTALSLSCESGANEAHTRLAASALPPTLLSLSLHSIGLDYDAPLPQAMVKMVCYSISPGYRDAPFPLPATMRQMVPRPAVAEAAAFGANIRIIALLPTWMPAPLIDAEAAQEWEALERILDDASVRSYVATAFASPCDWDFSVKPLEPLGLVERLMPRLALNLVGATGVATRSVMSPLLTHARWLSSLQATTAEATDAFVDFVIGAAVVPGHPMLPHLLQVLALCVDGTPEGVVTVFKSVTKEHPEVQLSNVRRLVLQVDPIYLCSPDMAHAVAHLFPHLTHLEVQYTKSQSLRRMRPHSACLQPIFDGLPRLERFRLCSTRPRHIVDFAQSAEEFMARVPAHVKDVFVAIGASVAKR